MHTAIDCGILSQRLEFQQVCAYPLTLLTQTGELGGSFYVCVWCHSPLTILTLTQESNLPLVKSHSALAVLTLESLWEFFCVCVCGVIHH